MKKKPKMTWNFEKIAENFRENAQKYENKITLFESTKARIPSKIDPNHSFLVKKNTERIKKIIEEDMSLKKKKPNEAQIDWTISIDDDIPF